jgi:RNA polymerase sigma factor (sigma-70 family)
MKEDHELVSDALAKGAEGFKPIMERYQHAVFGVAFSRVGDFHDSEDIAQQVFVEAFQRLAKLKDPGRLGAWLRSITINRSIDLLRRRKKDLSLHRAGNLASGASSPQAGMEKKELQEQVMAAISRLPLKQRETLTLFYVNGYSVQDIAMMADAPVSSVKRRLHDARKSLRKEMLNMVEDRLKAEVPKEDFAQKVFALVARPEPPLEEWPNIAAELRRIGARGAEGLVRALQSPDWRARVTAAIMIRQSGVAPEPVVEMLRACLSDSNQGVRGCAASALLALEVGDERKRREFVPLIVPHLGDLARGVRRRTAELLRDWAADVPLEAAAGALAREKHRATLARQQDLVLAVLEAREEKAKS